ncbi:YceI family protein [Deinococcus taeanensis]|uniref:YceI family protein n=1 Tax=Deinococcus taeanensis TaxID=2737050 RepID=UPI001CDB8752|nr:YceI family protein [Deinococcus taeanensis]UBV43784.1 YceI family protein [Deinococcus taeanensis]
MKRTIAGLAGTALVAGSMVSAAPYRASDGTATFTYTVRFIPVRGTISGVSASVTLDPANLAATAGTVTVPVANLKTGISLRDAHAKREDALNAAKFPNATFTLEKLTGGKLVEGQTLATTATGKLTVKGTAKAVSVPVKATLQDGKVNVSTQFKFNPFDFDVRYPGSSDSVTVEVSFVLTTTG